MNVIPLTPIDLALAALLVLGLGLATLPQRLGIFRQLALSSVRMVIQLALIGFVLKALFANVALVWVVLLSLIMVLVAGREVLSRQKRRLSGWLGYGVGTVSMFLSSFTVTLFALAIIVAPTPWYEPQYAIPLLGMLLGNNMNGIALAINHLTQTAWQQRAIIEQRLMLGQSREQAISDIRRESMRTGMIPIINAMAAAGIVSLPGMMTGQILAGSIPTEAVKYQILIMFMITAGTGFGTLAAVWVTARLLFDPRHRLRLDRLKQEGPRPA